MKKLAAVLLVVFATSNVLAGTVTFTPLTSTSVLEGETIRFEIGVEPTGFDSFNLVGITTGSDDGLQIMSLDFSQEWADAQAFPPPIPAEPAGSYASDLFFGGFLSTPAPSFTIGTLTVGTTGLATGDYQILVDGDADVGLSFIALDAAEELLFGSAGVTVLVPEPATLALLGLGGIAVLRRRRRS